MPKPAPKSTRRKVRALGLLGVLLFQTQGAGATLSVLAADTKTKEVGAAVVSCVGSEFSLAETVALDASHEGVIAQSYFHPAGRDELLRLLGAGESPAVAINAITSPDFDSEFSLRQYAAIDLEGQVATFTGSDSLPFAASRSDSDDDFVFTIQGNVMVSTDLLDVLDAGFSSGSGDLASRLASALEQLGNGGQGDSRCAPRTADAGYFARVSPKSAPFALEVTSTDQDAALVLAEAIRAELPEATEEGAAPRAQDRKASRACQMVQGRKAGAPSPLLLVALLGAASRVLAQRRARKVITLASP